MTQKEIEELRKDPIAQILSSISGIPIEDLIKEFEKEMQEKSKCTKDEVIPDCEPTYPFSIGEFKQLIYCIQDIYREENKLTELGVGVRNMIIWAKTMSLIEDLLEIIFDEDIANIIIDDSSHINEDPDNIVYNIIDHINTRND